MSKRFFKNYQEFINETSTVPTVVVSLTANYVEAEPIQNEVRVFSTTFSPDSDLEQINNNNARNLNMLPRNLRK